MDRTTVKVTPEVSRMIVRVYEIKVVFYSSNILNVIKLYQAPKIHVSPIIA